MNRTVAKALVGFSVYGIILVFVLLGPAFTVWSIDVLFRSEKLELSFSSWCAALWIMTIVHGLRLTLKKY